MLKSKLDRLIDTHGRKAGVCVPARLQSMLALLGSLRELPSLNLADHLSGAGQSLKGHETLAASALKRLGLTSLNKNSGRRSSNLHAWANPLLEILASSGYQEAPRTELLDQAQQLIGTHLRLLIEEGPIRIKTQGKTAEAIIGELLKQADKKNKGGDVAQYLVGAKLTIRLQIDIPVHGANKGDRKSHADTAARLGDFEIENCIIEVAIGIPDEKHLQQIEEILDSTDREVWLLTREDRVASWKNESLNRFGKRISRVVVTSVESFVGQNITELAGFSSSAKIERITELVELYNRKWVDAVGTPSIRISIE
ncbi:MAG: DUF4928 family protein [Luteolibacter sp.]